MYPPETNSAKRQDLISINSELTADKTSAPISDPLTENSSNKSKVSSRFTAVPGSMTKDDGDKLLKVVEDNFKNVFDQLKNNSRDIHTDMELNEKTYKINEKLDQTMTVDLTYIKCMFISLFSADSQFVFSHDEHYISRLAA